MKILFVGASGFGNIGDDAYRTILQHYLGTEHQLRFHSPYPDLAVVEWAHVIVVGGGGLIYCNNTAHFEYMQQYMQSGKPLHFCSVGVQLAEKGKGQNVLSFAEQIRPWEQYFRKAKSITVRCPMDAELIAKIVPDVKVQVFPDLVYAFPDLKSYQLVDEGASVVVPTNISVLRCREVYDHYFSQHRNCYILALHPYDFIPQGQLRDAWGLKQGQRTLAYLTPQEVYGSVFKYSTSVLSGRYHGNVLAKAAGVPHVQNVDSRYKSRFEPEWSNFREDALGHIRVLKETIRGIPLV